MFNDNRCECKPSTKEHECSFKIFFPYINVVMFDWFGTCTGSHQIAHAPVHFSIFLNLLR